jgi:hypothetical protein
MHILQAVRRAFSRSPAAPFQPPHDQKMWIRFPSALEACCGLPEGEGGSAFSGCVSQICERTITIQCHEHLAIGTVLDLRLQGGSLFLTGRLQARVTRVGFDRAGIPCIDCDFLEPLSEQERKVLL